MHGGVAPRISGFSSVTQNELKTSLTEKHTFVVLAKIWVEEGPQLICQSQRRYAPIGLGNPFTLEAIQLHTPRPV
jgi:hypothetical protein